MAPSDFDDLLRKPPVRELALGYRTVRVFEPHEIEEAQLGYRIDPAGSDLTSQGAGAWQPSWFVVAAEDECGDPIFIDAQDPKFPVYTAAHGEGSWEPQRIAPSLSSFLDLLGALEPIARQRPNPVALQSNPIPPSDHSTFLDRVRTANFGELPPFWESWLEA